MSRPPNPARVSNGMSERSSPKSMSAPTASSPLPRRIRCTCYLGVAETDIVPIVYALGEPGVSPTKDVVLRWRTFSEAANEAGISRRVGGIHFRQGDVESRRMGRKIGKLVWNKAETYFDGTATP